MINLKNFVLILIVFFSISSVNAAEIIAYIDMDKIMNISNSGKKLILELESSQKKTMKNFLKIEENLKKEEKKLISQKNILSKDEFDKEIEKLRVKSKDYRIKRRNEVNELTKKRLRSTSTFIKLINPILAEYSSENSISIILEKKNIVIGKSDLDITNEILLIVNNRIKSINLK